MARPLRLEFPGALYHLTSRGNAKADIFLDDADRRIFLRILGSTIDRYGWLLHAYCLMGNHYHLLAATPRANLSRGMRQLNGVYTQCFNRRHKRVGHVFQGRFTAILVERETYLLELARYIPLNPVRAGFVTSAEQWQWSSFRATAGLEAALPWLDIAAVRENFGSDPGKAALRFQEFVKAGVKNGTPWSALRGQIYLGSEQFAQRMGAAINPSTLSIEIRRPERFAGRPALASLLTPAVVQDRRRRNAAIVEAHTAYGYSLAEIARHLGLHYSTVSRVARAADASIQDLTPA
jgi:REP element-mobilizing transposase RayT